VIVGTVREIKNHEYRVGLTPETVQGGDKAGHWSVGDVLMWAE